jgi:hypothetical protein
MDFTKAAVIKAMGGPCHGTDGLATGELGRMNRLETALALTISILALLVVALGLAWAAVWEVRSIIRTWTGRGRH